MSRARWVVRGLVQGVGFRWFVYRQAQRLGLSGYVENRADGSVDVVAEGLPQALDELGRALARGPAAARVESLERLQVPPEVHVPKTFDTR